MIKAETALAESVNGVVLCIIDFTDESKYVLHASIKVAAASKANLTVLYPYRLTQPRSVPDISQWKRSIDTDARNNFSRMTNSWLKEYDVVCEFKSEVGFVNDRVSAFAEKNKIGIVILGKQMVMSNREAMTNLFQTLECPLLIIPKQ